MYLVRVKLGSKDHKRRTQGVALQVAFALDKPISGEPTSGLEPLYCSLRVIGHALQGFAQGCKCRIFRGVSFLRLAACCTVLRSRWYQSGINRGPPSVGSAIVDSMNAMRWASATARSGERRS